MRAVVAVLLLAVGPGGCATIQSVALTAPSPPPVRPAEVTAPAPSPATWPQPELPPPALPPPAPLAAPPMALPAPPAPPVPPPSPPPRAVPPPAEAPAPPATPPLVLSPQVSSEDEQRIQGRAQQRIDGTERMVRQIDQRKLAEDQHQNLLTIQSFLGKAKEALAERDMQRAVTLADKAYLLADELVRGLR